MPFIVVPGGLFPSASGDSFVCGSRREKHYHKDYRTPKDEIRDYPAPREGEPFPDEPFDKYRHRYTRYHDHLERTYPQEVREKFCDNRATDTRSYTERRKKTVRFNSEGWENLEEDLDPSVDSRWTSAHTVYYDEDRSPSSGRMSNLLPLPRESSAVGISISQPQPPAISRRGPLSASGGPMWSSVSSRELPIPLVRKEPWEVERQESQDSQTKDSGIDSGTSSNFNSSEDSSKGDILPRSCRVGILEPIFSCNGLYTLTDNRTM